MNQSLTGRNHLGICEGITPATQCYVPCRLYVGSATGRWRRGSRRTTILPRGIVWRRSRQHWRSKGLAITPGNAHLGCLLAGIKGWITQARLPILFSPHDTLSLTGRGSGSGSHPMRAFAGSRPDRYLPLPSVAVLHLHRDCSTTSSVYKS